MATKKKTTRNPSKFNKLLAIEYKKELSKLSKKKITKEVYNKKEVQKAFKNASKKAKAIINAIKPVSAFIHE